MQSGWRPGDYDDEELEDLLFAAARLYDRLVSGGALDPTPTSVLLEPGEIAYADLPVQVARLSSMDGAARWWDNHTTRVVLTDRRLLVYVDGSWVSFDHRGLAEFRPDPDAFTLELFFHGQALPMRLLAPEVPALSVALGSVLFGADGLRQVPAFARFDADAEAGDETGDDG